MSRNFKPKKIKIRDDRFIITIELLTYYMSVERDYSDRIEYVRVTRLDAMSTHEPRIQYICGRRKIKDAMADIERDAKKIYGQVDQEVYT